MKRFTDLPYYTYSAYNSEIFVHCPKCSGMGIVTDSSRFHCTSCHHILYKSHSTYRCDIHNICKECGRYYRTDITDKRQQHFSVLYTVCPYCGCRMLGTVHKTPQAYISDYSLRRNGCDPVFGFPLWFCASFDGKPVWALNRRHLFYLIDYLSANLREDPPKDNGMQTQSDQLPAFMKSAKNRKRIVKLLKRMAL